MCVVLSSKHVWTDHRLVFGVATLVSLVRLSSLSIVSLHIANSGLQGFVLALHIISHSLTPHSSTWLLFYELASIATHVVCLRTAISLHTITPEHPLRLAFFIILVVKLVLFTAIFNIELLGPDGWDGMTWRSWLSLLPGVRDEGKIRLEGDETTGEEPEWEQKECPRLRANIFERLTFSWLTPMMRAGREKYLTEEDLWSLPPDDTAEALGSKLERHWVKRKDAVKARAKPLKEGEKAERPNLTAALAASFGGPFFVAAIFKVSRSLSG